jgi:hypothetical protein
MLNLLYFSNHIKPVVAKIRFMLIVLIRFLRLLFRRDKQLTLLTLDYSKKYQFNQSLLVIQYQFKNALWYHFKEIKRTTKSGLIVLNLSKIPEFPVVLTIHGLFRKKIILIGVTPEATMQPIAFRTKINHLRDLKYRKRSIALYVEHIHPVTPKIKVKHFPINMSHTHIIMKRNKIHFEYPSFNQTEFL